MAPGLFAEALVGVDDEDRGVSAGRARDHVLEEFLVAGCIDDGERAAGGPEGHPRGVHRVVLRLFLEEGVHEERIFELHALGFAGGLDVLGFALGH